jgi:hypothetical protein
VDKERVYIKRCSIEVKKMPADPTARIEMARQWGSTDDI